MSKQEAAESYPQQLTLNFDITVELKTAPVEIVKNSSVVTFVDSATLAVRRHAIERVLVAGIFAPPKSTISK
jgi:hypothetical protein